MKFLQKSLPLLSRLTLIFTFLVILAGSVVRVTQSGMGCPDWPKCFGYYIPPSDPDQVNFHPNQAYTKGMMVIVNDTLWRAKQDFSSTAAFDRTSWEKYPKHDYADFIVYQTWVEYINRLLGALLGLFVLAVMVTSLSYWKTDKLVPLCSFILLFLTGFQAWLGKLVVDGNLIPQSISIHMLAALLLLLFVQLLAHRLKPKLEAPSRTTSLAWIALGAVFLTVVQVLIGTQVREEIDLVAEQLGHQSRELWIDRLSSVLTLHKAFSLVLVTINGILIYQLLQQKTAFRSKQAKVLGACIATEIMLGIVLNYFNIPQAGQSLHLLVSCLIFSIQFGIFISLRKKQSVISN
jgi:cytochrome c oxidase assembly protein subunit 15